MSRHEANLWCPTCAVVRAELWAVEKRPGSAVYENMIFVFEPQREQRAICDVCGSNLERKPPNEP